MLDTVQVQPWIPYSKHSVMCFRLDVDTIQCMVQPWVFHGGFLYRDAFGQITCFRCSCREFFSNMSYFFIHFHKLDPC
jgi:hypothetical protein